MRVVKGQYCRINIKGSVYLNAKLISQLITAIGGRAGKDSSTRVEKEAKTRASKKKS